MPNGQANHATQVVNMTIGSGVGSVSSSLDYSVLPGVGQFFAGNNSIAASSTVGLQQGLPNTSLVGFASSLRAYIPIGPPYKCN